MASPIDLPSVLVAAEAVNTPASTSIIGKLQTGNVTLSAQARAKKRPGSPAACLATPASNNGKKKTFNLGIVTSQAQMLAGDSMSEGKTAGCPEVGIMAAEPMAKPLPFKDATFVHSGIGGAAAGKKNRTWKNLKQILTTERALPWNVNDPNYFSIDAPPSLKPAKKYSDISGLPAYYTDPQTKLRFTSSEEFSYIRLLPSDVVTGYLALRKATCAVP